tara:strand:+ start:2657 stop:2839 length:183 start_codon:yes stop_codon:yes gene_type:complete
MSDVRGQLLEEIKKSASLKGRNLSVEKINLLLQLAKDAIDTGRSPKASKLTLQLQKLGKK